MSQHTDLSPTFPATGGFDRTQGATSPSAVEATEMAIATEIMMEAIERRNRELGGTQPKTPGDTVRTRVQP